MNNATSIEKEKTEEDITIELTDLDEIHRDGSHLFLWAAPKALEQTIDAVSFQLSSAYGDLHKAEQARKTLAMLHESSLLLQAKLSACPAAA